MLARTFSILIIGFWLIMIGLLIRKEAGPAGSSLREVPVEHVIKLLLLHHEQSDLNIANDKLRLGHLHIQPHMQTDTHSRVIDFTGDLQVVMPGMDRQSIAWDGKWELEKTLATRHFDIGLNIREAGVAHSLAYHFQITVSPPDNLLTWTESSGENILEPLHSYTLDEAGLQKALQEMRQDPALLQMLEGQKKNMASPVVRAFQSSMLIRGERIDTYLVTIEQSGQTLLEFDVSQLGQILRAKTLIGYTLSQDDFVP